MLLRWFRFALLLIAALWSARWASAPACADGALFDGGKLLGTAGVIQLEGAGGGGLVPWALITGYGTRAGIGGNAHYTFVGLPDFRLNSGGAALGFFDRVELSYARLAFNTGATGAALGLGRGFSFGEDVVGVKLRLIGDAVYDQDRWLPQIAVGAMYKQADSGSVPRAVGARETRGADFYVAFTKILLRQSLLLDGTVRLTRANQFGLLGFGGDRDNAYHPTLEGSAALLLTRRFAIGVEGRSRPDNLRFAHEDPAFDVFAAWFLNKHASITAAFLDLGRIANRGRQDGVYISLQAGF